MALTVGELQVLLDARTEEFRAGLQRAEGRLNQFEQRAAGATNRSAVRFRNLGVAVGALVGIIAGLAATRALINFARSSVDAASRFEAFGVQIQNFVGSQEAAADAVERFTELASRTPFAVSDVVSAGAQLGSVALGNVDSLERLTQTAANLAAVTGLGLREAAGNLQRALTTGIASADLFRERGVRALIESIAGIPDLTAEPLARQRELFDQVFGPEGVFGQAAANLSFTLGGAISNVGDAVERLQASFGAAFAPASVAGLREFLIPFLDNLRVLVDENRDAILAFVFDGIQAAVQSFASFVRGIEFGLRALAQLQRLALEAQVATARLALTFVQFTPAGLALQAVTDGLVEDLQSVVAQAEAARDRGTPGLESLADAAGAVADQAANAAARFQAIDIEDFARQQREATRTSAELEAALEAAAAAERVDAKTAQEQARSLTQIEAAEKRIQLERLRAVDSRLAERQEIENQIQDLRALNVAEADRARVNALITQLRSEQARITREIAEGPDLMLAEAVAGGLSDGFQRFVEGDPAVGLGDVLLRASQDSLDRAFQSSLQGFQSTFENVLDGLADDIAGLFSEDGALAGLGGTLGRILGNESVVAGALGIGGAILRGLTEGETVQTAASNVASAVTSAQQVRGVVAGPTSIAVGEVFRGIQEANVELERLARVRNATLSQIESNTRGASTSAGGGAPAGAIDDTLAFESESLV